MKLRAEQVALTRRSIVDAFIELSSRPDAKPVGIAEVARHSGISAATIYRHFSSRDVLLSAAANQGITMGVETEHGAWTLRDLEAHLVALWGEMARNLAIARDGVTSEAGREMRLARYLDSRDTLLHSLRLAGLRATRQRTDRLAAAIALLFSAHAFLDLHDRQGLAVEDAAAVARWAIEALLAGAGVDPAQFRLTSPATEAPPGRAADRRRSGGRSTRKDDA